MSNGTRGTQQLRNWCFTFNNPPTADDGSTDGQAFVADIYERLSARYVIAQLERGENGTLHYQGYIEFRTAKRLSTIKRYNVTIHWEQRRGTRQQAIDYCRKDDSRVDGPWEMGESGVSTQGTRSDIAKVAQEISTGSSLSKVATDNPTVYIKYARGVQALIAVRDSMQPIQHRDKKLVLVYGEPGIGKTYFVRTQHMHDLYVKSGCHRWWDGYNDHRCVCIDDFAGGKSGIPLSSLLNIMDKWDTQVEIKGGTVMLRHDLMFITTNIHPKDWYEYEGRQVHYEAIKRRVTQVWTMEHYVPKVLDKEFFFSRYEGETTAKETYMVPHNFAQLCIDYDGDSTATTEEFSQ